VGKRFYLAFFGTVGLENATLIREAEMNEIYFGFVGWR
jgi:hypothetical protein